MHEINIAGGSHRDAQQKAQRRVRRLPTIAGLARPASRISRNDPGGVNTPDQRARRD